MYKTLLTHPVSSVLLNGVGGDSCREGRVQGLGHRGGGKCGNVSQWNGGGGGVERKFWERKRCLVHIALTYLEWLVNGYQ